LGHNCKSFNKNAFKIPVNGEEIKNIFEARMAKKFTNFLKIICLWVRGERCL
jgi:hypothetical protein